ncbi:MAG: hypothetical protein ACE5JR_01335 [Gemmatimonadota bacterium]
MHRKVFSALACVLLAAVAEAQAQSSVGATATITIPQVLFLSVDETAISFNQPAGTDFETGWISANQASTVTHKGNVQRDVQLSADVATFTATNDPINNIKQAGDFEWSTDGGSTFFGITTAGTEIVTAAPKGASNVTVNYRTLLDYTSDAPDTYTLNFTYTVIPN